MAPAPPGRTSSARGCYPRAPDAPALPATIVGVIVIRRDCAGDGAVRPGERPHLRAVVLTGIFARWGGPPDRVPVQRGGDPQADFLNDPWEFLEKHIVMMGMEGYGAASIKLFRLEPYPLTQAYATDTIFSTRSEVFVLKGHIAGPATGFFNAHWCPYEREETKFAVIDNQADYCFTATITGCSIGLGHETVNGSKLIVHSNHGSTPDTAAGLDVAQTQERDIRGLGGATIHKVFGPSSYRLNSRGQGRYTGTVVGWRGPGGAGPWEFRTQTYEQLPQPAPQKYRLHKLVKM